MIFETKAGKFKLDPTWNEKVSKFVSGPIAGIGSDKRDNIYVLTRSHPAILIFDKNANLIKSWDNQLFSRPHGIHIVENKSIYVVDDAGHATYEFDLQLNLIRTFGNRGIPSDTGCINKDYKTIKRGAEPFNYPTDATSDINGNIYISDGYGNSRVHKFDSKGSLIKSWGEPGNDNGNFNLPHGILYNDGILYVSDRQNNRIQLFDCEGKFLGVWDNLIRPAGTALGPDGNYYVAECSHCSTFNGSPSRITIFSSTGKILGRLDTGCGDEKVESYHTAHGIAVDSEGSIYIGEVGKKYPEGYVGTQKYVKCD